MTHIPHEDSCIFCDIIAKKKPATLVMETPELIVIKDIAPSAPIHYLIIPKEHVRNVASLSAQQLALGSNIFACAQKLAQSEPAAAEFKLITNNGYKADQRVFHLHVHFLAGF